MIKQHSNEYFKRMSFKGNKVWVQTDDKGQFLITNNKVRIKYNLKQDYEYQVHPESLKPEDQAVPAKKKSKKDKADPAKKVRPAETLDDSIATPDRIDFPPNCIQIYTDGASSGNPGPSGIGALLIYGKNRKEISRYIGQSTNNIAELTAIKAALLELKRKDLPVRIFTDSSYALGLLTKGWKPKKNQDLVTELITLLRTFNDVKLIKVKGHAGIKENKVADYLATSAIKKGPKSSGPK